MKIAILILLHEFTQQQKTIIQHLSKQFDIFVHVDKKSNIEPKDICDIANNVFAYKRYKVYWGSYNQILATLYLFEIANARKVYSRYVFISDSDVPIKTNRQVQSFFEHTSKEYLYFEELPRNCWEDNGGYDRIDYFHNKIYRSKNDYLLNFFSKLVNRINTRIFIPLLKKMKIKRNRKGLKYYGGPNWMDLTDNCVSQLLDFTKRNFWYVKRFKYTRCADEIFFQSLILNFCENIEVEKKCLRYVDWRTGPEHPRVLRMDDFEKIKNSDCLFARKVNFSLDYIFFYKILEIMDYNKNKDKEIAILNPLVTIRCLVYNEAPYLRQCLDGFVMQKTAFPFVAVVHDDSSTDKSSEIIQEYAEIYPDIIKPIYEIENQWSKHDGSLERIMTEYTHGKYVAWCEGDDYWFNPYKLQKQVAFLEAHPDYGLCYSLAKVWNEEKKSFVNKKLGKKTSLKRIMWGNNYIPTCTVCMRTDIYMKYRQEILLGGEHKWRMGDLPLWIYAMINSKVKFLKSGTAVYRIRNNSASHSDDVSKQILFRKNVYEIKDFFKKQYNLPYKVRNVESAEFEVYFSIFMKNCTIENWNKVINSYKMLHRKDYIVRIKYLVARLYPKRYK